jgi:xanthine dehydrogenase accessory factor
VVVASHGHEEERILTAALREGVPYVGLVASDVRGDAVRASLELPEELRARLHTPAGLAIGARTPEETALAILAEVVALQRSADRGAERRPLPAAAAGRGDDHRRGEAAAPAPVAATTPIEVALDPVCGMEVAVSDASIQLERDGERYYFCSEGCRDSFAAEGAADAGVR